MTDILLIAVHAFANRVSRLIDTAALVGKLVYKFQRATVSCEDVTCLIKPYIFRLVCFAMEANVCSGSFQTM